MISEKEARAISERVGREIKHILEELESSAPGMTEGFGALMGAGGGAASFAALSTFWRLHPCAATAAESNYLY